MYFYPRPLRGGRQPSVSAPGCNYIFLSTPSARRATGESCHRGCRRDISIHALCEEGDGAGLLLSTCKQLFLSTPSARRATPVRRGAWSRRGYFYPRPLRGGRPRYLVPPRASFSNFYPRPLRGGRLGVHAVSMFSPIFLSTPSARRATITCCSRSSRECISIHALCEEGDLPGRAYGLIYNISIHALCEEGDRALTLMFSTLVDFYPRPLRGGRRIFPKRVYSNIRHFYPRPLRGGRREHFGVVSPDAISIHALCEEGDFTASVS